MNGYFIPYVGNEPVAVDINGHRLVIVSQDRDEAQEFLGALGGDRLKEIHGGDSNREEQALLEDLAETINGDVILAPSDVDIQDLIRSLESELPWIQ